MFDHYQINVALNGRHFFATTPHSIRTADDLLKVLPTIKAKFPEAEGFKITVTHWETRGRDILVD